MGLKIAKLSENFYQKEELRFIKYCCQKYLDKNPGWRDEFDEQFHIRFCHHMCTCWMDDKWFDDENFLIRMMGMLFCGVPRIVNNKERAMQVLSELYSLTQDSLITLSELIGELSYRVVEDRKEFKFHDLNTYYLNSRFEYIFEIVKTPAIVRVLTFLKPYNEQMHKIVKNELIKESDNEVIGA